MKKNGFTILELLLVIAIIAIIAGALVTVVFLSKQRATDSALKNDVRELRSLAEVYYNSQGYSYTGWASCVTDPSVGNCSETKIVTSVSRINRDLDKAGITALTVYANSSEFCMSVPLSLNNFACSDRQTSLKEGSTNQCSAAATCE